MNYPQFSTLASTHIIAYKTQSSQCCGLVFACCYVWICSENLKPLKLLCKIALRIFISRCLYILSASKTDCSLKSFVRWLLFGLDSPWPLTKKKSVTVLIPLMQSYLTQYCDYKLFVLIKLLRSTFPLIFFDQLKTSRFGTNLWASKPFFTKT